MSVNARYQDIDDDYEELEEKKTPLIMILSTISKWFIRIGIAIAVILAIYFLFKLQIANLLLFAIGLIVAYFFGYFFMFCLDKLMSLNDK